MNTTLFHKLTKPIRDKIAVIITKGLLESVDDTTKMQLLKLSLADDELQEEVEHVHPYGLSSNCPTDGGEILVGCLGGSREHAVALVVGNSKYRIKNLPTGEVCVYSKFGQTIMLKTDGSIELNPASGKHLKVSAPTDFTGDVNVTGKVTASQDISSSGGDVKAGAISLKLHTHLGTSIIPTVTIAVLGTPTPGTNAGSTGPAQ